MSIGVIESFESDLTRQINEYEVSDAINRDEKLNKNDLEVRSEAIAFTLNEDFKSEYADWGTYFGPKILGFQDGSILQLPTKDIITKDVYDYWVARYNGSIHPVLKARYAGLIFDFAQHCTGSGADYKFVPEYIDSLIAAVESRLLRYETSSFTKIKRALSLALRYKLPEYAEKIKKLLFAFEKSIPDDKPGLWIKTYEYLIQNKGATLLPEEEKLIIDNLEGRLERITAKAEGVVFNPNDADAAVQALEEYYRKKNKPDDANRVVLRLGKAYEFQIGEATGFEAMARWQRVFKFYQKFKIKDEVERVLIKLREIGPELHDAMRVHRFEINLPKDKVDRFIEVHLGGSQEQVLAQIATSFIPPSKEVAEKEVRDLSINAPLQFIVSKDIVDDKGRTISVVGSIDEDIAGHIAVRVSDNLTFMSIFLDRIMQLGIEREILTVDAMIDFIGKSAAFTEDRMQLIKIGINAYFKTDYITSIHLLIPQIEEGCRHILEQNGGNTWVSKDGRSFQIKLFEKVLREPEFDSIVSPEVSQYFRILFTDQRGWNVRNDLCHGLLELKHFTPEVANRVIHALLVMGLIRYKEL